MAGNLIFCESIDDPRLAPYRALKDRDIAREGNRFIAEGEQVVRRLIASDLHTESVLLSTRRVEEISTIVRPGTPIYVLPDEAIAAVLGFKFHSGVMAVGIRPGRKGLGDVLSRGEETLRLVICPETANTENLGGMIRIAAAFGVDAMILGERSCDPFFRQCVRVSMGTVFRLPLIESQNLLHDLQRLRAEWAVHLIATVIDRPDARMTAQSLTQMRGCARWALLFGNEAQGLSSEVIDACDHRLTIPMKLGTDSLNVMVAAGIFLYEFTRG